MPEQTNEMWEGELKHLLFTLVRAKDHYEEVIRNRAFIDLPAKMAAKALDKAHQDIKEFISEERKRAQEEMLQDLYDKYSRLDEHEIILDYALSLGLTIKE